MTLLIIFILSQGQGITPPQDTLIDSLNIVHYSAKRVTYDLEKSLIILHDSAFIAYRDITLLSDSAYYHLETHHLEAFGTCDLRQKEDSILGDYLRYNLDTKKAVMHNGRTKLGHGWLTGKEIYWVDENTINAYHGTYTSCDEPPPHYYYFYSPRMKVYVGNMVIARPIVLYIHDFPVAAAPFWFVPIAKNRKSGLLPFRLGNSREFGNYIRGLAYYLVISDYIDATLQVDALEKQGIMPHVEGVWNFEPFSKGKMYASYINDQISRKERYSIQARNVSDYFLFGSSLNFDIKYVSDNTYQQDYAETTALWLETEIASQATISRNIFGYKNNLSFERREKFTDTATTIDERFPMYTIASPSKMLFSTISYGLTGHVNRERTVTPQGTRIVSGANLHTAPSLQQTIFGMVTVSPRSEFDIAMFDEDTEGNTRPVRFGYSFGIGASTNLYRVFDVDILGIHGILHKVSPQLTYSYTPEFDFSRFPSVRGIPSFSARNSIGFGLNQVFEAKIGEERNKITVAQINLNSSYNFATDSFTTISYSVELPYNPLPPPLTGFSNQLRGTVDPYTREYTYVITNVTALSTEVFSINCNQSYTRGGTYQIWFRGSLKPTTNWAVSYAARYDWQEKKLVDYSFSLSRDLRCWEALFTFNQLGDSWRYDFKVRIKTIPDVSVGKGLFGYVLD
jgi:lipopolysaccharide assembly outer membrane protein LptD (OstA)